MKIHAYTGGVASTNGYVLETGENTLIIVDAAEGISGWLKLKFPAHKVTHLLLTHMHFDHIMDAAALKEAYGCVIVAQCPYNEENTLMKGVRSNWGIDMQISPFEVDIVTGTDDMQAVWGGLEWMVRYVPGHSPDSSVYYLPEEAIIFTGDTIFANSIGRTDFPGGNMQVLLDGLRKQVLSLPQKTAILPGHGHDTTVEIEERTNPFL